MRTGKFKQLFARYVAGSDRSYHELWPSGKFARLLWFASLRFSADRNGLRAVALTYYTLFAIVPMLALAFGIAKGFALQEKLQEILNEKLANQRAILDWICQFADSTLRQTQSGVIAGVGVIVLLWTVMGLANNVEKSFNAIWNLPARENIFRRLSDYLALILITPFLIIVLSSAAPVLRRVIGAGAGNGILGTLFYSLAVDLTPLVLIVITFTVIYLIAPNTRVRFLSALTGGLVAGVLFHLLQEGFIILQTRIFHYNKVYGSFAVLPLFLVWLKLSWQIALFGAEISFVHQHIGIGLFDRLGKVKISQKLRREYQLLILGKIFGSFNRDQGAVDEETILKKLPLPQVITLSMLDELVESGVLYKLERGNAPPDYLPAHPSEHYTVCDALAKLDESGLIEPPTPDCAMLAKSLRTLDAIHHDAAKSPGNLALKELDEP